MHKESSCKLFYFIIQRVLSHPSPPYWLDGFLSTKIHKLQVSVNICSMIHRIDRNKIHLNFLINVNKQLRIVDQLGNFLGGWGSQLKMEFKVY